ncbi:signal recognition particle-docking protein FtsY, partial [Tepidimonas alkaliphilus]|uniref:signal recognition particle-docking protein FtsY n=1 Tax=Tepidimonas alkaliphilus TaxID=2588942 RepID=UPI003CCC510A
PPDGAGPATPQTGATATSTQTDSALVPALASSEATSAPTAAPPLPARPAPTAAAEAEAAAPGAASAATRQGWLGRLREGLKKTGASLSAVFAGARIDETLYEELETALLLADAGAPATQALLDDLRRRVRQARASDAVHVRALLVDVIADWLQPLQKALEVGAQPDGPTVWMVAGVNGAGKTTTIGKLTWHLAQHGATVLLAAADTFRAAAREQLGVWAERNGVDIVAQAGGDPAAVAFDAVSAGRARGKDVVIVDTAGRLPTQLHLMEELRKVKRVVAKAEPGAPHEVLLVLDGHTGQNALAQVKAFDAALGLTGLIVTKLDGTAKGGVLCAIAQWAREQQRVLPVYFIGIGEKLEDLQPFDAREFAQALLA